ncbi:MAG: FAD-linked oxidase C-terminal domain-containing protein [Pseudomonadota bacterium]
MEEGVKKALIDIVGVSGFSDSLIDLVSYSYDASDHDHRPEAALWPKTSREVSEILSLANRHRIPVTPRGAGTSLSGGAVPVSGGIVMDLSRMNRIMDIRIRDRLTVVQPGVVYGDLEKALEPYGFFFPPDPASGKVCTIGGNVGTNAGGIRGAKYGVTRDYVMALEVVLPDGRLMRTGSGCMKSVSGYDLTRLFVGSEGTLGVFTEITLKISPKPTALKTSLVSFSSLRDAGQSVTDLMHSGVIPSVLEILDDNSIRVLRKHGGMDLPEVQAMILVETDGYTEAEASFQMDRATAIFRRNRATHIRAAGSSEESEALWKVRRTVGSVAARLRANNVSEDVTVPMSKVPDLLDRISDIVRRHDLPFVIFGHAGDGNLHPRIMYDGTDPEQVRKVNSAVEKIFQTTCEMGGTLTGEHGIGLAKAPYMALEHDGIALELMRSIKAMLDPNHILNPGKMALGMGPARAGTVNNSYTP